MESQANNQELFTMPAVTRNAFNTNGKKISVATNLFTFVFRQTDQNEFFTFALIFEPEIPGDAIRLKTKLFSLLRPSLPAELYGNVILSGMNFIGTMRGPDGEAEVTLDDIPYKITYKLAKTFKANDTESESLYKRFFASLVRKMNFVTIRKNYYNPSCGKKLQNGNLDLWPGFNFTINRLDNRILLSMNLTYRVIRKETALDLIKKEESKISRQDSVEARLTEALKGLVVITRYGKERCYIVDSVVTSMDINSTFPARDKDGNLSEVSFKDYYQQKYRINLREGQPLLKIIEKRRGVENTIYLIPELCLLSGITDDMRANFNLMKEMNTFTKGVPKEKLDECKNLIDSVKNYEKCRSEIEKWGMTIDTTPVNFNAVKLDAGNLMLGNKQVSSNDPGLDRNVQTVMFSQPGLKVWGIFYMKNDQKLYDEFYNNFKESCRTYQYNVQPPKLFPMNSNRSGDWEAELSKIKNLEIDLLLFIIPGSRGKGPLYDYIKRYCTCETSIPTQCILTGTLSKGKGLRSITNKVLVQMCAKIGGIPWVIDNLPFTNMPTMIIGIDSTGSKNSMLGFTASLCRNFSTYFSRAVNIQSDDLREVRELTKQALETVNILLILYSSSNERIFCQSILLY